MTDKELQRLSRAELLEMLLAVSRENEELHEKTDLLTEQLNDKNLSISNAGSLAEAALKLNGIFDAAQAAADQYLNNVKNPDGFSSAGENARDVESAEGDEPLDEDHRQIAAVRAQAEAMLETAKGKLQEAENCLAEAQSRADEIEKSARERAQTYWVEVSEKLERFYEEHKGLLDMMNQ